MIDETARVARADPDEGMRVVQAAVQKALMWMVMRSVGEEMNRWMG